jgi:hypothetical protein
MFDSDRIKRWMRWTKKRFKDKTIEQVWAKIQENPKLMEEYSNFHKYQRHSPATQTIEFATRAYGWKALVEAMWIMASRKEELTHMANQPQEQEKWTKVKDTLSKLPRNVQL